MLHGDNYRISAETDYWSLVGWRGPDNSGFVCIYRSVRGFPGALGVDLHLRHRAAFFRAFYDWPELGPNCADRNSISVADKQGSAGATPASFPILQRLVHGQLGRE